MAMNRIVTMAEKEVRDYAQRQMERAEQRENIVLTEEQKEQILEYATLLYLCPPPLTPSLGWKILFYLSCPAIGYLDLY